MPATPLLGSYGDNSGSGLNFRNKIINGGMSLFQRQTAATVTTSYSVDRWLFIKINDATESVSQNTDAPSGFSHSLRQTISIGDTSIGSGQYSGLVQPIEGYNIVDLAFGTSAAKSVTLSFWVRSSVPGVYTGNIGNSDGTRLCPFNYTINNANTWEYKTTTLPGCTDGVWNITNGVGLYLRFYSALGSSLLGGTAGVWNSSAFFGSGSPVNGIASNGNIFAITGVQLESGTSPSPFEVVSYSNLIAQCQRYYEKSYNIDVAPLTNTPVGVLYQLGASDSVNNIGLNICFKVPKRITPTGVNFAAYTQAGGDGWQYGRSGASGTITNALLNLVYLGASGGLVYGSVGAAWVPAWVSGHWVVSTELT
jgi:hypothetical protein